jgi:hypothetical protein
VALSTHLPLESSFYIALAMGGMPTVSSTHRCTITVVVRVITTHVRAVERSKPAVCGLPPLEGLGGEDDFSINKDGEQR